MREAQTHEAILEQLNGDTSDYCREVIRYFDCTWTDTATIDVLTAYIHEKESSTMNEDRIRTRLHHVTLPKLAKGGLVDYDPKSNTARYQWNSLE